MQASHEESLAPIPADDGERSLRQAIETFFFAYRAFTALPDRMLGEQGLGRVHHRILYFVGRDPGCSINELLHTLGVSKQALNLPLRELVERDLVGMTPDEHDRRIPRLCLTRAGEALERALSATQMQLLQEGFATAGTGAEQGWRAVMHRLIRCPDDGTPS